jgi:hypothetical protein
MHHHEIGASAEQRLTSDLRMLSSAGIYGSGRSGANTRSTPEAFHADQRPARHLADRGAAWEGTLRRARRN